MSRTTADWNRLELLQHRLRTLELRIAVAHERPILEVARAALRAEVGALARRLGEHDYWRPAPRAWRRAEA